jgi:Family of unknown function (DUF5755)
MKKCQPGVICIENMTLIIILFIAFLFFMYFYKSEGERRMPLQQIPLPKIPMLPRMPWFETKDVLRDPYEPPLSDDSPFIFPPPPPLRRVPINISTNPGAVDASYRQVGILTPHHSKDKNRIIPLMGRPLYVSRNKWQYYTMTDKTNSIKLPILYKGRSCTNEYGCDELMGGEHIFVEGYDEGFKVTKYDNDTIRYIPFL